MFGNGSRDRWQMGTLFRPAPVIPPPPSKPTKQDIEAFFDRYRSLLPPEEFGKFHKLIEKTRPSRGHRYYISSSDGDFEHERGSYVRMEAQRSRYADLPKMEIILVEDVDVRCLVPLDAAYGLDPQFLLAYTGVGDKHSPGLEAMVDPADMAGKWYITEMSMILGFPWQVEDSSLVKTFKARDRPLYKTLLARRNVVGIDAARPWWKEEVRTSNRVRRTTIRLKIACYCLTDKLRLVLVESLPQVLLPSHISINYEQIRPLETHSHLSIPLKHWKQEAFSSIDILGNLICRLGFQHEHLRHILLSDEFTAPELAEVAKQLDEVLILSPLIEYMWSSSVKHLSHQLSLRRSEALVRPSMETYLPLVDLRRPIFDMLDAVSTAIQDIPAFEEVYRKVYPNAPRSSTSGDRSPWSHVLRDARTALQALQRELKDEIPLVIGAVTVQDSDASKRQAERATLLTLVAAVYLPLTLVTSIFGMKIREIDGNLLTYRACLKALGVVLGCTIVFALGYREWRPWRRTRGGGIGCGSSCEICLSLREVETGRLNAMWFSLQFQRKDLCTAPFATRPYLSSGYGHEHICI